MNEPAQPLSLDAVAPEVLPRLRLLPVIHGRVDMAGLARLVLDALDPAAVAVEIPTTLERACEQAVARLPRASVVISEAEEAAALTGLDEEPTEDALVWLVVPGDPLVEALRWARERGRRRFAIDPDVRYAERHLDAVPDPQAIWEIGAATYLDLVCRALAQSPAGEADALREMGMAFHLQRALDALGHGTLLALVGAAHVARLAEALQQPAPQPLARVRRERVELRHLHPDSLTALLHDPPLAHAAYERLRGDALPPCPAFESLRARKISLVRQGFRLVSGKRQQERRERAVRLVDHAACTCHRTSPAGGPPRAVDRGALGDLVWRVGAASYEDQTQEAVAPWQGRLYAEFLRRYTRIQGRLLPGLYEWVVAARGVGDDNLAWEVFDAARTYPWQDMEAEIPTARVDGEMLDLGTRKVTFRRRFFRVKQRPVRVPVQRRQVDDPAEWLDGFRLGGFGLCSYPPEDIVLEDYGRFLKQKAMALLSSERRRTEPFTASLLDGIDIRETLRNLHEDRVYVQELGRVPGAAGSVVVIFDRDRSGDHFPYLMTWLGEHDEESDMAFYATNPAEQIVGPGIMRATYGGFMLTLPPGRLGDVWRDPDYAAALEKAEVLVMAAVDYSEQPVVVHVAKDAPAERLRHYAALRKRRLVHIPIGSLSPVTLKKLRVVHLLAGHDKRAIAKNYIW